MKLLMESWREFLKEVDTDRDGNDDAAELAAIGRGDLEAEKPVSFKHRPEKAEWKNYKEVLATGDRATPEELKNALPDTIKNAEALKGLKIYDNFDKTTADQSAWRWQQAKTDHHPWKRMLVVGKDDTYIYFKWSAQRIKGTDNHEYKGGEWKIEIPEEGALGAPPEEGEASTGPSAEEGEADIQDLLRRLKDLMTELGKYDEGEFADITTKALSGEIGREDLMGKMVDLIKPEGM